MSRNRFARISSATKAAVARYEGLYYNPLPGLYRDGALPAVGGFRAP
jgi:hypothetical protein